jgi:hypothetical protein
MKGSVGQSENESDRGAQATRGKDMWMQYCQGEVSLYQYTYYMHKM